MELLDWVKLFTTIVPIALLYKWMVKKYTHWKKGRDTASDLQKNMFQEFSRKLEDIRKEVKPNGGTSLNDKVTEFGKKLVIIDKRLEDIKQEARINKEIMDVANWESDQDGRIKYVSITLCEIIGCSQSELLDKSWIGFIDKEDRERVIYEWEQAIENASEYNIEYNIIRSDGLKQKIKAVAVHIKDEEGNVIKTLGRITKIGEPFRK